ncbi:MAG: trans-aconitate 2-methyltransferase [Pedobacter sp.]|nr:MAG: trans-aconitate 2-methyltransferase [Pedobacter sp.]
MSENLDPSSSQNNSDTWSASQYSKFEQERNRPIKDLIAQIKLSAVNRAVDIGCGPGNSTELLAASFPDAILSGIDSSPDMIAAAKSRLPNVSFSVADITSWKDEGPYDIILANASLQWIPDHQTVFPALINKLSAGGVLAVQMPDNFEEPAHQLMRHIASKGPWKDKLANSSKRIGRETAVWYYEQLQHKVSSLDIWRTTYFHPMAGGAKDIVEWFKGTGLRPFLDPLAQEERNEFIAAYTEGISKAYPINSDGSILLPYPRLFILATK